MFWFNSLQIEWAVFQLLLILLRTTLTPLIHIFAVQLSDLICYYNFEVYHIGNARRVIKLVALYSK